MAHIQIRASTGKKSGWSDKISPRWTVELIGMDGKLMPICGSGMNDHSEFWDEKEALRFADKWKATLGWEVKRIKEVIERTVKIIEDN